MNEIQKLQLELIRHAEIFDGKKVVADLKRNERLWSKVIGVVEPILLPLDKMDKIWNIDTIYIVPSKEKQNNALPNQLVEVARRWKADFVGWVSEEETAKLTGCYPSVKVLKVWWDIRDEIGNIKTEQDTR